MSDEWWNLDQAIAWVMTRDKEITSSFENKWVFHLILHPDIFGFVSSNNTGEEKEEKSFVGDKRDLLSSLRKGDIVASGQLIERYAYQDVRREILPAEWQWLELNVAIPQGSERVEAYGDGVPSWRNIKFSVKSLKKHFPETPFSPLEEPDKQELQKIIEILVEKFRQDGKTLNREMLCSVVNAHLAKGQVTMDWAKEAIKEIPSDVKNRRGRPRKKKTAV